MGDGAQPARHCLLDSQKHGYTRGLGHSDQYHQSVRDIHVSRIPTERIDCPACGTMWTQRAPQERCLEKGP